MGTTHLTTPLVVIDLDVVDANLDAMAAVRPGDALRSHVKAHKCTRLAAHVAERTGSRSFCCATLREVEGMVEAGLGHDLLLANETLDAVRLRRLVASAASVGARVTVAVDSAATVEVAAVASSGGPLAVLGDVNVGLPRCGCAPSDAGAIADLARAAGLHVRGVMGYEGHVVGNPDRSWRSEQVAACMERLREAHGRVGGEVTSAGGTGTFDLHDWVGEVQAGSYVLMDTAYEQLGLPFRQAAFVESTVVSVNEHDGYVVADAGLKSFGMDHGDPMVVGHRTFFLSDEHITIVPSSPLRVGERMRIVPAHIDPTMALHTHAAIVRGDDLVDVWPIDLRHW